MTTEYDTIRKELGERLRNVREQARLTQAQVATMAGVDLNYYARIERGTANPSFEKLCRITKALKIKSIATN